MKKLFLIIWFAISFITLKAQVRPVYFYGDKVISDKNLATSYAVYGKLSDQNLWMFKRYDLRDNLLQTGSYNDETLSTPHGKFTFYASLLEYNNMNATNYKLNGKTRFVSQDGNFVNGKEEGRWFTYYPDGNVASYFEFIRGICNGPYKEFDKLGNVKVEGNFLDGKKNGEWISEKGTRIDTYENGILKSTRYVKKAKKVKGSVNN